MEVAVFSFGEASCLVVVQIFTSSTQVQSTGPVIVTRFFFHMCVFLKGAMGLQFLFMDDNAPCHRTVAAEQLLESEDIERMDWPAGSPDLNLIEHVWDFLGRRLAALTLPPVTIRELRLAHQDEWAAMPQQLIHTLILSMGTRCETCLAVREIISPTKDRMFLAGHPSQGCFGLQSHCAPCYFFNQASFYPSDFSFILSLAEKCTLHELQSCLESLQSVTQNNDLVFVTTRAELLALCTKLKDSVSCVDEHMTKCFSPTQTKVFNHVVAGARQFLSELCLAGPIQEAYLKHSPCYKNVSLSEEKCAPKYRHLIHLSENVEGQRNIDEGLRESCW
ncbi:transposable element Tcb2 transposase [Trichonephila clavipes]|nr:transposable element Tcb2 transposase [Trichonephila clavipes]